MPEIVHKKEKQETKTHHFDRACPEAAEGNSRELKRESKERGKTEEQSRQFVQQGLARDRDDAK
jgi:hypothetical protein